MKSGTPVYNSNKEGLTEISIYQNGVRIEHYLGKLEFVHRSSDCLVFTTEDNNEVVIYTTNAVVSIKVLPQSGD